MKKIKWAPGIEGSCGVCAVACITERNWYETAKTMFRNVDDRIRRSWEEYDPYAFGCWDPRIIRGVNHRKSKFKTKQIKAKKVESYDDIPDHSIIMVMWEKRSGHYVVYHKGKIYDNCRPYPIDVKRWFGKHGKKIKSISYIHVEKRVKRG